jgi:hypothetical protein
MAPTAVATATPVPFLPVSTIDRLVNKESVVVVSPIGAHVVTATRLGKGPSPKWYVWLAEASQSNMGRIEGNDMNRLRYVDTLIGYALQGSNDYSTINGAYEIALAGLSDDTDNKPNGLESERGFPYSGMGFVPDMVPEAIRYGVHSPS